MERVIGRLMADGGFGRRIPRGVGPAILAALLIATPVAWGVVRRPIGVLLAGEPAPERGGSEAAGGEPAERLEPGGMILAGTPPDAAVHLFALDEAMTQARLGALVRSDGEGDGCSGSATREGEAGAAARPDAPGGRWHDGAGGTDLRASPRLAASPSAVGGSADAESPCPAAPAAAGTGGGAR